MGELSVRKALDRIFDASHQPGVKTPTGPGSVAGRSQDLTEKLAKTVALANTSAPRDAPRLYNDVLETAAKELPAATAGQVKKTVLAFAAEKAALSLPELANSAYRASAAGQTQELKKDLAGLKGWEGLVPLANAPELRRVIADAKPQSEPHIWFRPSARGLEAVLPQGASAVKPLPKALASGFALQETAIAIPLEEQAQAAFLAAPTASNGAGWIFQTQRQAGASLAGSVVAAASYWTRAAVGGLWQRLRAFVLRLFGYGVSGDLTSGLQLEGPAPKGEAASADWGGARLRLVRGPDASAPRRASFAALKQLEDERASAAALLGRGAPLDWKTARALVAQGRAIASLHQRLTADGSGPVFMESLAGRLERSGSGQAEDALVPVRPRALIDGPGGFTLRGWMDRLRDEALEASALTGRAPANLLLEKDGRSLAILDLTAAGAAKSALDAPSVRVAARALLDGGLTASVTASGGQLWTRFSGRRAAKLYGSLRSTDEGGELRLAAEDAALFEPLARLGFAVTPRGTGLTARVSADNAQLSADELETLAARALRVLETGQAAQTPAGSDVSALLKGIVSDVSARRPAAALLAAEIQSLEPSPSRFRTIGRVGPLLAQSASRTLADGRALSLTVLRDPETGQAAFGRAEVSGAALSPAGLRSLLRLE